MYIYLLFTKGNYLTLSPTTACISRTRAVQAALVITDIDDIGSSWETIKIPVGSPSKVGW